MSHTRIKLLVAGLVLAGAVVYLGVAAVGDGWVYYLHVDQFTQDPAYTTSRVRLHGTVGEENLDANPGMLYAHFDLEGETTSVRVNYEGTIPDMFKAGHEVVVEGRLDENGVFQADSLMTKCASKYETEGGEAPHADPRATKDSA